VLRRMTELGHIDATQYEDALKAPMTVKRDSHEFAIHAEHVAEMVRQAIAEQYPDDVYTRGFRVYTTIKRADQEAAYASLRRGVLDYDRRHGYRGPEAFSELADNATEDDYDEALAESSDNDDMLAAVVTAVSAKEVTAVTKAGESVSISGDGLKFVARSLDEKAQPQKKVRRGSIIRVQRDEKKVWQIVQLPEVESAFVSMDPSNGAIHALVGGFDFNRNKFNHVTQAWRQPGSSFKPFIYSASLEKGFTPATVIPDEPLVIEADVTGSQRWEPKNYDGKFEGPMRMRTALAKSKNMVSIRVLKAIGTKYAQDYVTRFGFDADKHPPYLTMALGAGSVTLWQMARAYGVFANSGYLIQPYFIHKIVDDRGNPWRSPTRARGDEALRVLDARNAFIMDNMMQDVTRSAPRRAPRARPQRPRRQDRHDQRLRRRLVRRLSAVAGRHRRGSASTSRRRSARTRRRRGRAADLADYMEQALKDVPSSRAPCRRACRGAHRSYPTAAANRMVPEFFYQERCRRRGAACRVPPPMQQPVSRTGRYPSRRTPRPSWPERAPTAPRTAPSRRAYCARPGHPSGSESLPSARPPRSRAPRRGG
jgi:membrane carboxypeptidase/penicillin-binding protein